MQTHSSQGELEEGAQKDGFTELLRRERAGNTETFMKRDLINLLFTAN